MDYQLTLNWPDFIERYWQKRPVVLDAAVNFVDPISPDELAGLAMESEKSIAAWSAIRTEMAGQPRPFRKLRSPE
jgi:ribosomal protein L16 Arg81 hydroxylase